MSTGVPRFTRRILQPPHQVPRNDERRDWLKEIDAYRVAHGSPHDVEAQIPAARVRVGGTVEVDRLDVLDDRPPLKSSRRVESAATGSRGSQTFSQR